MNYLTGELMDIPTITAAGRRAGAVVGWDLAHAVGNVPLAPAPSGTSTSRRGAHYKYLNSGPGAVAGAFVHAATWPTARCRKLQGWWSTDEATRFAMGPVVDPVDTRRRAGSCPTRRSSRWRPCWPRCEIFDEVGMAALRERSVRLTGYLEALLDGMAAEPAAARAHPARPAAARLPALGAHRRRHAHGVLPSGCAASTA